MLGVMTGVMTKYKAVFFLFIVCFSFNPGAVAADKPSFEVKQESKVSARSI